MQRWAVTGLVVSEDDRLDGFRGYPKKTMVFRYQMRHFLGWILGLFPMAKSSIFLPMGHGPSPCQGQMSLLKDHALPREQQKYARSTFLGMSLVLMALVFRWQHSELAELAELI